MSLPQIIFAYDKSHAHNAILWLLNRNGGKIDKLSLIKMVFFSDVEHLLRYGRPIVGGSYFAMEHGPVSSEFYDELKHNPYAPFELDNVNDTVSARCAADLDELSKSDLTIMGEVWGKFSSLEPYTLSDISHAYKAWKQIKPGEKPVKMSYEDFFLDANPEERIMLENIREDQEAWEVFS